MSAIFYRHPCIYLEAVELVYAYVNQVPARKLAFPGQFSLPVSAIEEMLQDGCRSIDPEDAAVQFYFASYQLGKSEVESPTCLARLLAYSYSRWDIPDTAGNIDGIQNAWSWDSMSSSGFVFTYVHPFGIGSDRLAPGEPVPFANGLGQLKIPTGLKEKLLETFSDYAVHVDTLSSILQPVMQYLETALAPWVERAEPLIASWEERMQQAPLNDFIRQKLHYNYVHGEVNRAQAALIFFQPQQLHFRIDMNRNELYLQLGATAQILASKTEHFTKWELKALRLLSGPMRMNMLYALGEKTMTAQEIITAMGDEKALMSTVTRDLYNMHNAGLLNLEFRGARRYYSINGELLDTLSQHLRQLCPPKA